MTYEKDLAGDLTNQPPYTAEDEYNDRRLKEYKECHKAYDEYEEFIRNLGIDAKRFGRSK